MPGKTIFKADSSTVVKRVFELEKILYFFLQDQDIAHSSILINFFKGKVKIEFYPPTYIPHIPSPPSDLI
jgi:hypothetical protein